VKYCLIFSGKEINYRCLKTTKCFAKYLSLRRLNEMINLEYSMITFDINSTYQYCRIVKWTQLWQGRHATSLEERNDVGRILVGNSSGTSLGSTEKRVVKCHLSGFFGDRLWGLVQDCIKQYVLNYNVAWQPRISSTATVHRPPGPSGIFEAPDMPMYVCCKPKLKLYKQ
jgi:hypothetical protein